MVGGGALLAGCASPSSEPIRALDVAPQVAMAETATRQSRLPCGVTAQHARKSAPLPEGLLEVLAKGGEGADDPGFVDVLVLYTRPARAGAGSVDAIEARIASAVVDANAVFERSGISTRLRLAHTAEIADECGDMDCDLANLMRVDDGVWDEAHALRAQYAADLVMVIQEWGQYCGLAEMMSDPPGPDFAAYAFGVVSRDCLCDHTFAHEVGHLFGCNHDVENGGKTTGATPFAYGHRFIAGGTLYRTVMAYEPGKRAPYFSNPMVAFEGVPTGTAEHDNARTIVLTAPIVANFSQRSRLEELIREFAPPPAVTTPPGN